MDLNPFRLGHRLARYILLALMIFDGGVALAKGRRIQSDSEVETDETTTRVRRQSSKTKTSSRKWKAAVGLGLNAVQYTQSLPQRANLTTSDSSTSSYHAKIQYQWNPNWSTFISYKQGTSNYNPASNVVIDATDYTWSAINLETFWKLSAPKKKWSWGLRSGVARSAIPFLHINQLGDLVHKDLTLNTAGLGVWFLTQWGKFSFDASVKYQIPIGVEAPSGDQVEFASPMFYEYGATVSYPVYRVRVGLLLLNQTFNYDFSYSDQVIQSKGKAEFGIFNVQLFTSFQF
ncbi:MAG: hypothetical protein K2Q26_06195 [Bdellovibrionales bacterium]|nr:hypothetical protein [Bdellovibrionales bacterium]